MRGANLVLSQDQKNEVEEPLHAVQCERKVSPVLTYLANGVATPEKAHNVKRGGGERGKVFLVIIETKMRKKG